MTVAASARRFGPRHPLGLVIFGIALVVVAKTLASFASRIQPYLVIHYDWRLELALVLGQVAFQWAFMVRRPRDEKISYAWVLIFVSSLGAILLWPLLAFGGGLAALGNVTYFFAVVGVMFAVHWLLVVRHGLPRWLCASWVLYRLFLLAFLVRW